MRVLWTAVPALAALVATGLAATGFAASAAPHLEPAARDAARRRLGAAPGDFVVLFAGKLEARKHPIDAVRAHLHTAPPDL